MISEEKCPAKAQIEIIRNDGTLLRTRVFHSNVRRTVANATHGKNKVTSQKKLTWLIDHFQLQKGDAAREGRDWVARLHSVYAGRTPP
jgi:hypothetical protein